MNAEYDEQDDDETEEEIQKHDREEPKEEKRVGSGSLEDEIKNKKFTHFSGIIPKGICEPN